ncbi:hypothetical protein DPMN_004959 [Dreissena polymorpha]|uniref:Uncharacterized protein n=1 Tax=Dreissena polymorpha TaxID=45954 RepID=A0A9D4MRR9_DREPO|nr:hypothetical protein DPMN_004959 [Dreissena polymorpha]
MGDNPGALDKKNNSIIWSLLLRMRAGQHLKKGHGTLKNIFLDRLGNNVDFKRCCPGCRVPVASLKGLQRVGVFGSRTRWWTFYLGPWGDE